MIKKLPYQPALERPTTMVAPSAPTTSVPSIDWRQHLPALEDHRVRLREVRVEDAASLLTMLAADEVARFTAPWPSTVEGFVRYIERAAEARRRGESICYAIVPEGCDSAAGLIEVRAIEPGFGTAEWTFALSSSFWGTGVFVDGARLVLNLLFDTMGVHRLEARAAVANGRGNGALRKIGAVQEGLLRRSFLRNGAYHDQVLWSILAEDWHFLRGEQRSRIH